MKKYLLLGSGSQVLEWYREYGEKTLAVGYMLVAINNAWQVDPEQTKIWLHSNDYEVLKNPMPDDETRSRFIEPSETDEWKTWKNPFSYERKQSGTMFLNACFYLINRAYEKKQSCIILVAGCNMHYPEGKSHFYGNGGDDPLRLGIPFLKKQMARLKDFTDKGWYQIYNVSLEKETLLPFNRIHPCVIGKL